MKAFRVKHGSPTPLCNDCHGVLGRVEPCTVPEDTAASRSLDIIAYLPIHAGPEVAAVPVVQRWKSGHPREGAKRASSPSGGRGLVRQSNAVVGIRKDP